MKTCSHCKESKDPSEFYQSKYTRDKLQSWCKACLKGMPNGHLTPFPKAKSTALAQAILNQNGIPSVIGWGANRKYTDLVAWACVPIEAKISSELGGPHKYMWTFTSDQLQKFEGLLFLIALHSKTNRVFIVPSNAKFISNKRIGRGARTLCVTLDCDDPRSTWPSFAPYENRFDLVEQMRLQLSAQLRMQQKT